jgi:hypothetical protein
LAEALRRDQTFGKSIARPRSSCHITSYIGSKGITEAFAQAARAHSIKGDHVALRELVPGARTHETTGSGNSYRPRAAFRLFAAARDPDLRGGGVVLGVGGLNAAASATGKKGDGRIMS